MYGELTSGPVKAVATVALLVVYPTPEVECTAAPLNKLTFVVTPQDVPVGFPETKVQLPGLDVAVQ